MRPKGAACSGSLLFAQKLTIIMDPSVYVDWFEDLRVSGVELKRVH